jgi:hypothetical protein
MIVTAATISMPHRHTVRYNAGDSVLEFEVEPAARGVIFYPADPKVISGNATGIEEAAKAVEAWLRDKFAEVDVDQSPKPSF